MTRMWRKAWRWRCPRIFCRWRATSSWGRAWSGSRRCRSPRRRAPSSYGPRCRPRVPCRCLDKTMGEHSHHSKHFPGNAFSCCLVFPKVCPKVLFEIDDYRRAHWMRSPRHTARRSETPWSRSRRTACRRRAPATSPPAAPRSRPGRNCAGNWNRDIFSSFNYVNNYNINFVKCAFI